jgi:carboxyl-terminal processing protease
VSVPQPRPGALGKAGRAVAIAAALGLASGAVAAQAPQALETFDAAWRIVRDSHFDKSLNGVDWNGVSAELRPRAAAAKTVGELRGVLRDMLGRLGQSHFTVIPATADVAGELPRDLGGSPGFDVRLVGKDLLVTEVDAVGGGATAGVRTGWKLQAVDGAPVPKLLAALPDGLEPRLRQVEAWRTAHGRLRGPAGSRASMTFEDGAGRSVTLPVERRQEAGQPVTVGSLPTMFVRLEARGAQTPAGRTAGIIGFNVWMAAVDALFQRAVDDFREKHGIVIDLRGNPGGLAAMLMGISGHFIDERKPLGVMTMRDNHELRFNVNPRRVNAKGERVQPFDGPVAILVDDMSGSASECFTGGMQSVGRARVFGQQTMGQALPALFTQLPNGDVLVHAYGDFVTADGTRLEGRGVVPDEVVPLSRDDLLAGRDRTLEAALAWIDSAAADGPGSASVRR